MATGTLTLQGVTSGGPGGQITFGPLSLVAGAAQPNEQQLSLSIGNNTITVPSGTTWMVLLGPNAVSPSPNPAYAGVLTLKGANGDTGVAFSSYGFQVLNWAGSSQSSPNPPASIVVNATVACTLTVVSA